LQRYYRAAPEQAAVFEKVEYLLVMILGKVGLVPTSMAVVGCLFAFFIYPDAMSPCSNARCILSPPLNTGTEIVGYLWARLSHSEQQRVRK
jgi:hypothetical protein